MIAGENVLIVMRPNRLSDAGLVRIKDERGNSKMKRVKVVIIAGICLGIILLAVQIGMGIDPDAFMRNYWIAAPFLVIGAVIIYVGYQVYYQRKMRKLTVLLEQGKAREYVDGMMMLRETVKGKNLRNVIDLNLAAGYVESKQYGAAVMILESLPEADLKHENLKLVYGLNLCMSYFENGKREKAKDVYEKYQVLFKSYREDKTYGDCVAKLDEMMKADD